MVEEPPRAWGLALLGVGTASLTHSSTKKMELSLMSLAWPNGILQELYQTKKDFSYNLSMGR